jgi:hydroxymethylpyrimidine/phosphomethylpyrimidine kinase
VRQRPRTARGAGSRRGASPPRVLVCAGLDPSGGAGLLADLEALAAVGARGWAVATALTAQGPRGARLVEPVAPATLLAQVDALLDGLPARERPRAVKIGMLGTAGLAAALASRLAEPPLAGLPLVVDPVLAASSGLPLLESGRRPPLEALAPLLARAALVTPNWPELERLAGARIATEADAVRAARALPARAILVKGGHRPGPPVDLLVRGRRVVRFPGRRRAGGARGTGCRLASAVAGLLAAGMPLEESVRRAKRAVEAYIDRAARRRA